MIEEIVLNYINDSNLHVPAYTEKESNMPEEYILIQKTGSGGNWQIKKATIVIQSFSVTRYKAAQLNEAVKELMEQIIELDDISKCSLNSDYDFTDTESKKYRYQAVFDIVHY